MADRTRGLKLECPQESGRQLDYLPTEVNPNEDGMDCNAVFLQSTASSDSTVYIDRDGGDNGMRFVDPTVGNKKLNRLVSNTRADAQSHQSLIDIIHFLDDGPGDGWPSGAVQVRNDTRPNGTGWVWYTSSAQKARIIDYTVAYPAGSILPSSRTWRLYAANGTTVAITLTDQLTWSGPILAQKQRVWT